MFCPSPVRSRWSSAAISAIAAKCGNEEVGVGHARADRLLAGVVRQVRDAGRRLQDVTVALPHRPGAGRAVHRHRDHDHVRPDLPQIVVGQAPGAHRFGGERLGHDVALGDDPLGQLNALWVLHVERAAEFRGVEVGVVAAVVEAGLVVDEGRGAAQRLGAHAALDPDHFRAVVREVLGDERSDPDPGEVGDADALEDVVRQIAGVGHCRSLLDPARSRHPKRVVRFRRRRGPADRRRPRWLCSPRYGARPLTASGVAESLAQGPG